MSGSAQISSWTCRSVRFSAPRQVTGKAIAVNQAMSQARKMQSDRNMFPAPAMN
jgi:hypothetical protein